MPRQAGDVIENKLIKGLITEATGLNFPEDAVTETWDCYFEPKGVVRRRLGIDIEAQGARVAQEEVGAIVEYLWHAVSLYGTKIFLVLQTGDVVGFYELYTEQNISNHKKDFAVDLRLYKTTSGDTGNFAGTQCDFASGNGRLFITHPQTDPIMVKYSDTTDDITVTPIQLMVRDFEGVEDSLEPDEEPVSLTSLHHYNLKNQGWFKDEVLVVTEVVETKI
jgi:hypothetical protein